MNDPNDRSAEFVPTRRIIVFVDLAGFAKAFQSSSDVKMASFLQDYYAVCDRVVNARGGTLIKFMGDACLAIFPPEHAKDAVEAVLAIESAIKPLLAEHGLALAVGANLHAAAVIDAEFGVGASRRRDILGRGVNQTFLLGRGAGIRISEPVYRLLPSAARSPWNRHKPPAVYHLEGTAGFYEGLGKDAGVNTARW